MDPRTFHGCGSGNLFSPSSISQEHESSKINLSLSNRVSTRFKVLERTLAAGCDWVQRREQYPENPQVLKHVPFLLVLWYLAPYFKEKSIVRYLRFNMVIQHIPMAGKTDTHILLDWNANFGILG